VCSSDLMMYTSKRQFKLVDLGLAKRLSDETSYTVTGQSMGTPHFISPEQILGLGQIDARADIYSLGATLYFMATGKVPFEGSSGAHIMSRHLNDPLPDPRQAAPELSDDFCCILGRMMAKKPEDRYQDVHALDRDLYTLQRGGLIAHLGPVETAMQNTVFTSATNLTNRMNWDAAELKRVTETLSEHIGPLAKILVKKASEKAKSCEELFTELQGHIRTKEGRSAFAAICEDMHSSQQITDVVQAAAPDDYGPTVAMGGATQPFSQMPAGNDTSIMQSSARGLFALDEATKAALITALSTQVGPVAKVLVKRALKTARSMNELVESLAKNAPNDGAARKFREAMAPYLK